MINHRARRRPAPTGFTLIELLIVIAIMALLFGLVATVSRSTSESMKLTTVGDSIYNRLVEIQQQALAKNQDVEVRFYRYADEFGEVEVRGIAFYEEVIEGTDVVTRPLGPPLILDSNYVISSGESNGSKLSTLVDPSAGNVANYLTSSTGEISDPPLFPPADDAPYTGFHFRSDGSTNLAQTSAGSDQWHITLVRKTPGVATDTVVEAPANYYTIRIDAYSGRLEKWRP